jgi:FMN phosphatase YigB (HAD superfamily)
MTENLNLPRGPLREGVDTPSEEAAEAFNRLIYSAKETFKDTAFVTGEEFTQDDVEKVKDFYRRAATADPWIFNQSTQETLFLVGRYSRLIGEHLNKTGNYDLNLDKLEALGLLHDIGRTFSHRRYRNDQIGDWMMKKAGFREEFLELIPSEEHWLPVVEEGEVDFEATRIKYIDTSEERNLPERAVVTIADIIGKIENGRIITWEEFKQTTRKRLHQPQRKTSGPKEYVRMKSVMDNIDSVMKFYESLGDWLEGEMGTDLEGLVVEMQEDLEANPLEKTFNQEKQKYGFDTVVFDLGGVIVHDGSSSDNSSIASTIARSYGMEEPSERITSKVDESVAKSQIGTPISEVQQDLVRSLGKPDLEFSLNDIYEGDASELTVDHEMVRLIKYLQNEGIRIIFASNIAKEHAAIVERKLEESGLNVSLIEERDSVLGKEGEQNTPIFTSYVMRVRKGGESGRDDDKAFYKIIEDSASLDPTKTLIVDDKEAYYQEAESLGFQAYNFTTSEDFTEDVITLAS